VGPSCHLQALHLDINALNERVEANGRRKRYCSANYWDKARCFEEAQKRREAKDLVEELKALDAVFLAFGKPRNPGRMEDLVTPVQVLNY